MRYLLEHQPAGGWKPCTVKARVSTSPPIKASFDVSDGAGHDWLRAGKVKVWDKHPLDKTAVTFQLSATATLTAEDLVRSQGHLGLKVTCYLEGPQAEPVSALCPIDVALPAEIETLVEPQNDDEAVLVLARVKFHIPAGPELLQTALQNLKIQAEGARLVLTPGPKRQGWKVVRVTIRPGETPQPEDLTLTVSAQVGYSALPQKRLVLPFALEGKLLVECRPQTLKIEPGAAVNVFATPVFRNPSDPAQMRKVLESLQLSFDTTSSPWLRAGARQTGPDHACWSVGAQVGSGHLPATAQVTVSGQIGPEPAAASTTLKLEADTDLQLVATCDDSDVLYDKEASRWKFEPLRLSLRKPGQSEPAPVQFACGPPKLSDDQNLLRFEIVRCGDLPSWTVKTELKDGFDLDAYPGTSWLEQSGLLTLTIRVEPSAGAQQPFETQIGYRLRPRLELVLYDTAGEADEPEGHYYDGADCDFDPLEFAADGVDQLSVGVLVARTDLREPLDEESRKYLSLGSARLSGPGAPEFSCQRVEESEPPIFLIQSKKPYLYTSIRAKRTHLTLQLKGQLSADAPPNYLREPLVLDGRLHPRYVSLQLWVVPGSQRGTSMAGAFVALVRPGQSSLAPLSNASLELGIVSRGGLLTLQDSDTKGVDSGGCQSWKLAYSGLNRGNLDSPIKVRCRLAEGEEAAVFTINVKDNGSRLFSDLNSASGSLQLTNPEWEQAGTAAYWVDWIIPKKCRGPVYNVRNCLASLVLNEPPPVEWSTWLCGHYSERITDWLLARRHGKSDPNTALRMNGLEVCQYIAGGSSTESGLHDWCGLHLSGNDVNEDPIFIDPWWEQSWGEEAAGYGWAQQEIRGVASLTFLVVESAPIAAFVCRAAAAVAMRAAQKVAPTVLPIVRRKLAELIARLTSGNGSVRPNTVRAVIAAATAVGAYLYQRFCIGASCHRPTCFDDHFNYRSYDQKQLLEELKDAVPGVPEPIAPCEAW